MTRSHHRYSTIESGADGAINWYTSLPHHVKQLYEQKGKSPQPAWMVVLAGVACEAFTVWALEELFKKKNAEALWKVLSTGSKIRYFQDICNDAVNEAYTALSGDQITRTPFWERLKEHNKRRNDLVHPNRTGSPNELPSPEAADASFKAVENYIQHVTSILNRPLS